MSHEEPEGAVTLTVDAEAVEAAAVEAAAVEPAAAQTAAAQTAAVVAPGRPEPAPALPLTRRLRRATPAQALAALGDLSPPDEGALWKWLARPELLAPDGRVWSWLNRRHPGYPYDEITAVLGRLWAWRGDDDRARSLGRVLERLLARQDGLARDGIRYVFDSALALPLLSDPAPWARKLADRLEAGEACAPVRDPGRWSQSFGAHLIKAGACVALAGEDVRGRAIVDHLVESCFDGERFRIHAHSDATYLHSHLYALEGLLMLGAHPDTLRAGLRWTLELLDDDGALPSWHNPPEGETSTEPGDIVAQALRLAAAFEPGTHGEAPLRLLGRVAALQDNPGGAIRYSSDSEDRNTWVSAFTAQALSWVAKPPSASERLLLV